VRNAGSVSLPVHSRADTRHPAPDTRHLRIAFIAPFGMQPKGTVSARMVPMAQALARRGHTIRIVVPPWDDPDAPRRWRVEDYTPEGAQGRVTLITLPLCRGALGGARLALGLVKHGVFSKGRSRSSASSRGRWADVAHVFKPIGYSGLAGIVLSALRVPWVLDVDDWEGPGGWADVNPYSAVERAAITTMEALVPRLAGAVTAASRALEARTWDMGLPRRRVLYVPNGVSSDKYARWGRPDEGRRTKDETRLHTPNAPVLLLYSRLAEFPYWWPLDVLKRVLEEYPAARLLVVGSGFFGEEEKLRAEADRMGIGGSVVVTGRVPEERLPEYLALGDVALYPMADNLINRAKSPVKVLEPMLMGLPTVAHRVGQAAEFVGDAGVLVDPGDVPAMAEAVIRLLRDEGLRTTLGERARERVWAEFSWDKLCLGVERAYGVTLGKAA
jgi:glycosyltransferase involved in cell wall biosynthesis